MPGQSFEESSAGPNLTAFLRKNRFACPLLSLMTALAGFVLMVLMISHQVSVKNYPLAIESFCYAVLLSAILAVSFSLVTKSSDLLMIANKMNESFKDICSLGYRYRYPFLKGQLLIWQLCAAWFMFVGVVSGLYVIMPLGALSYQSLVGTDEHTVRPLQFPLWLPHDDPYRTPNYELFLFFESLCVICFVQSFGVYVYIFFHIFLHYSMVVDMIILQIEILFDGLEENVVKLSRSHPRKVETQLILNRRVGSIVKMHLSVLEAVKAVSRVYGLPLLYQVAFSAIVMCLSAYQIEEKLTNGIVDIVFIMLSVATVVQLWIVCYLGTIITTKAFAIGDACWNCGWNQTSLGQLVRNDMIIIILKTQQPVTIKFIGQPNIQLDTFCFLMSKAYSYFNLLRQYK